MNFLKQRLQMQLDYFFSALFFLIVQSLFLNPFRTSSPLRILSSQPKFLRHLVVLPVFLTLVFVLAGCHLLGNFDKDQKKPAETSSAFEKKSQDAESSTAMDHIDLELMALEPWGSLNQVFQYRSLLLSRQPGKKDYFGGTRWGARVVVQVSEIQETPFDEKKLVEGLGLRWVNFPIRKNKPLAFKDLEAITSFIDKQKNEKVWVHCSNGDRTAAWLGFYLHRNQEWPLEKAIQEAERVGLRSQRRSELINLLNEK